MVIFPGNIDNNFEYLDYKNTILKGMITVFLK